ncbi:MAG: N-acetylmuramoyl-L-alanine amidase [Actinomycetota bacterium]
MQLERHPTPNYSEGRGREVPRAIIVHTNHGSFVGTVSWFGREGSGVSAHYLVGLDGRVALFVDEGDTAQHAGKEESESRAVFGRTDANRSAIGIEFEDAGKPDSSPRSERQYEAGGRLIREVAHRWNIPLDSAHIVGHRDVRQGTDCPGNLDVERLIREATE